MLLRQRLQRRQRSAFTLMEMLIVVAIIVALAGVGVFALMPMLTGGQKDAAYAQIKGLQAACQAYAAKNGGNFPAKLEDLLQKDGNGNGPYLQNSDAIYDPWSTKNNPRPYTYDPTGQKNNGTVPDISTINPKDQTDIISNWPKVR
ncbi:MAG: type II secretion system protein GspG [Planctomycetes bacterium]|nr:type II secretion system protein GspG [Planctomycetota bacterium]